MHEYQNVSQTRDASHTAIANIHRIDSLCCCCSRCYYCYCWCSFNSWLDWNVQCISVYEAFAHSNEQFHIQTTTQIKLNVFSICDFRNYIVYSIIAGFIYTVLHCDEAPLGSVCRCKSCVNGWFYESIWMWMRQQLSLPLPIHTAPKWERVCHWCVCVCVRSRGKRSKQCKYLHPCQIW